VSNNEAERTIEQQKSDAVFWSRVCWWIFAIAVCVTLFELFRHVYEWLRYGETQKADVLDWLRKPTFKWVGVQKIVDFIWNLPIWLVGIVTAMLTAWLADLNEEEAKRLGTQA